MQALIVHKPLPFLQNRCCTVLWLPTNHAAFSASLVICSFGSAGFDPVYARCPNMVEPTLMLVLPMEICNQQPRGEGFQCASSSLSSFMIDRQQRSYNEKLDHLWGITTPAATTTQSKHDYTLSCAPSLLTLSSLFMIDQSMTAGLRHQAPL